MKKCVGPTEWFRELRDGFGRKERNVFEEIQDVFRNTHPKYPGLLQLRSLSLQFTFTLGSAEHTSAVPPGYTL